MLRLGVVGQSAGNGHPWSWPAIFNGYDAERMARCPFPAIPAYLAERRFPEDALTGARVTHVWTQDRRLSEDIARAARIDHVAGSLTEIADAVDAVLLARDDAERHREHAEPFLTAGLPVYIDKPLATTTAGARELYALARRPAQIFTCSALRYAEELVWPVEVGEPVEIEATTPGPWETYGPHVVEPVVSWLRGRRVGRLTRTTAGTSVAVSGEFEGGVRVRLTALGASEEPIAFTVRGTHGSARLVFRDSFSAFRSALAAFVAQVATGVDAIRRSEVLAVVRIIQVGATRG
jgi:predicted dehydrogenase